MFISSVNTLGAGAVKARNNPSLHNTPEEGPNIMMPQHSYFSDLADACNK